MVSFKAGDAETARLILDDVENGKYKEALHRVDKKLKKTDLDYFKALQSLIKAHLGQLSEKGAILLQLEELALSKRVLTDLDAIQFYDQALELILPNRGVTWSRTIGHLRWQLVKATPKDVDAGRACFRACLAKEDYENARQIANSLEKNFPGNHEYVFWNITTMFLYSKHPGYPEKERKLYGALADGLIRKLADATVKAGASTLPLRSIQKPQELLLLDIILRSGDRRKTDPVRLGYLQSPFLGPDSQIAKGEWRLWIIKLELLKNQPELLFQTTGSLLKRARAKDKSGQISESRFSDWMVWKSYVDAASTNKTKYQDEVEAEIRAHLDPESGIDKTWRRNASLASLRFAFAPTSPFPILVEPSRSKKDLIVRYLQEYGNTNMTYTDLKPFVSLLEFQELQELLSILIENNISGGSSESGVSTGNLCPLNQDFTTASGITRLVNTYKLIYIISSSIPESQRRHLRGTATCTRCSTIVSNGYCGSCLKKIARAVIKSYGMAINDDGPATSNLLATDTHPADDLAILAAMCLTKLSIWEGGALFSGNLESKAVGFILQATSLLGYAWSRSKSNSQITLFLTNLYSLLGCGSLAFRAYKCLGIKQIQNTTLSYCLFDGIASTHPHAFPSDNTSQQRSVIEELRDQQKIYKHSPKQISNRIWTSFEQSNYNTVFELEEVKKALAYNVSAVMPIIESRRVSRLIDPKVPLTTSSFGYDLLPSDIENADTSFQDENDYDAMPNFEISGTDSPIALLNHIHPGNIPFSDRIQLDLFTEKVLTIVDPIADPVSTNSALLYLSQNMNPIYVKLERQAVSIGWRHGIYYDMAQIITGVSEQVNLDDLQKMQKMQNLQNLQNWIVERLTERKTCIELIKEAPLTQHMLRYFHDTYEVTLATIRLDKYLQKVSRGEEKLHNSCSIAEQLINTVIDTSSAIKRSLDEGGWIDKVIDSVFQGDLEGNEDTASISETLKSVVDENFMEEWAGEVVDSWKDSVKGFAYFKAE